MFSYIFGLTFFFFWIKEVVLLSLVKLSSLFAHETLRIPYESIVWWVEYKTSRFMSCPKPIKYNTLDLHLAYQ